MEFKSMSKRVSDQVKFYEMLCNGKLKQQEATAFLCISERQIRRKVKRFKKDGPFGLIHGLQDRISNRRIKQAIKETAVNLVKAHYLDYGPTLASEKLDEKHGIKIDHETLRRILIDEKLHMPRKKRAVKCAWREPKHHEGELVQLDGSSHIWFGEEHTTLIAFIDDATKKVFARFAKESTEGVASTFRLYLNKYGRPFSLYTDNGKVFKVNNCKDKTRITQFKRMLNELNIGITYARTPQAKGRIERLFKTLQKRLVKELIENNVTTIEQANAILAVYLENFNKRFSVEAKSSDHLFQSIDGFDLNYILCYKYCRILYNDYTISYKNRWLQLASKQNIPLYAKEKVDVYENFDKTITLWKNGVKLDFKEINKKGGVKKPKEFDARGIPRKRNHKWPIHFNEEDLAINLLKIKRLF